MKNSIKHLKKHWILLWLIIVFILLGSLVTFAQYTGLIAVKRVVTTQASPGQLFSSNCMWIAPAEKKINTQTYTVTVCNYEQKDNHIFSKDNIPYTLTAEICVLYTDNTYKTMSWLQNNNATMYNNYKTTMDSRTYKIGRSYDSHNSSDLSPNNPEHTFNSTNGFRYVFPDPYTLDKDRSSTDKFLVTFDSSELSDTVPDFYIMLTAESTLDGISPISCYLCASQNTESVSGWSGSFIENATGKDYDFYNYILSGTGKGELQVWYNPEFFEINPYFTTLNSASAITTETEGTYSGWKTFTIDVTTAKNRYEIQFYKKKQDASYTTAELGGNVKCKFTSEDDL